MQRSKMLILQHCFLYVEKTKEVSSFLLYPGLWESPTVSECINAISVEQLAKDPSGANCQYTLYGYKSTLLQITCIYFSHTHACTCAHTLTHTHTGMGTCIPGVGTKVKITTLLVSSFCLEIGSLVSCCVHQATWPSSSWEFSCLHLLSYCRNAGIMGVHSRLQPWPKQRGSELKSSCLQGKCSVHWSNSSVPCPIYIRVVGDSGKIAFYKFPIL